MDSSISALSAESSHLSSSIPIHLRARSRITRLPPALLLVYPSTLFLGFLYALISPDARLGANNTSPDQPVNYFARKSNILNQWFVKIGWFWTTVVFVGMLFTLPGFLVRRTGQSAKRRVGQAVLRYAAVTLSWIITTQWAFGPPLVDRGFTATGGKCDAGKGSFGTADNVDSPETTKIFSAAQCRMSGGKWKGGRDISGHVFMLALMSAFLFLEWFGAAEVVVGDLKETKEKQRQQVKEENEKKGEGEAKKDVKDLHEVKDGDNEEQAERWMRIIVWVMVGLSFWMLLMTAIFFHTWLEKIAGLVIALITIFVVYFLPPDVPSLRKIVGIPGF